MNFVGISISDHAHALFDGTVKIDGVDAKFESAKIVLDIFERMVRNQEYDASELSLTFYLRTLEFDDPQFVARLEAIGGTTLTLEVL